MALPYLDKNGLTYFWGKIKNYLVTNQPNWNQTDSSSPAYIANKPTITASTVTVQNGNMTISI